MASLLVHVDDLENHAVVVTEDFLEPFAHHAVGELRHLFLREPVLGHAYQEHLDEALYQVLDDLGR